MSVEVILQPDTGGTGKPIKIRVHHLGISREGLDQVESRRPNRAIVTKDLQYSAHESRLACAERTFEQDNVPRLPGPGPFRAECPHFGVGLRECLCHDLITRCFASECNILGFPKRHSV